MSDKTISIIVPAFNEEGAIGSVIDSLRAKVDVSDGSNEIIVINDGSTDLTSKVALEKGARVINHPHNKGYGASLKTGIRNARNEILVFFDGDGQHNPEDISGLVSGVGSYDMVIGARGKGSHSPVLRRPGKKVLSLIANMLAGTKIPDLNSGLRACKKKALMENLHLMPDGFSFSTTSTLALMKAGYNVTFTPINVRKRVGKSTVRQFRHGFDALLLILRIIVLFDPLKIFVPISFSFLVLGFSKGIFDTVYNHRGITDSTVLFLVTGILIFLFGLLADQVSALRRDSRRNEFEK